MTIALGSIVKINPEIFGQNVIEANLYGELGYVGILRHLTFRVSRTVDEGKGLVAYCSVVNPNVLVGVDGIKEVLCEGECTILVKDCILYNQKITLDYFILDPDIINKNKISALMKSRQLLKSQGKTASSQELKANWKSIMILRGEAVDDGKKIQFASIRLPKHHITVEVNRKSLPDETEESILTFKQLLIAYIKQHRLERSKIKYTYKEMFFEELKMVGGVYTIGGEPLKAYELSLRRTLDADKIPKEEKNTYVGIEIEFIHTDDVELIKDLFIKHRLHKNVQLTKDHSVKPCHNNEHYRGSELRILAKVNEVENVLARLSLVFNNPLVDAYVNRSCGLHVHLDCRKRDASLVYKNFVTIQDILRGSQPSGRINNKHCLPNQFTDINKNQTGPTKTKYLVVNPYPFHDGRGTIEIRVHDGSVDCYDILSWVNFLNAVANYNAPIVGKFKTALALSEYVDIPIEATTYVDSRIYKFNSLSI